MRHFKVFLIGGCLMLTTNFLFSQQDFQGIDGISTDNYPRVDGSTSTVPLNYIIAAKLLDLEYEWILDRTGEKIVQFKGEVPWDFAMKFQRSQTHGAIINLIDNQTDLIIVARKMSADEKEYANNAGVSLIETPIALDALDFILNAQNTVNSLSVEQIQNIYLGNITNWKEMGGADEAVIPFIRNPNSGSQEMMNEFVMNNTGVPDWAALLPNAEELTLGSMYIVYSELGVNAYGICFTPHYYKEYMVGETFTDDKIKTLAVNGIMSDKTSIKNQKYPFVAPVYVSIRSDIDQNSMTYKLYEWLQSKSGKDVINESGYVPYGDYENNIIIRYYENELYIYPNPTGNQLTIECRDAACHVPTVEIYSVVGQKLMQLICRDVINHVSTIDVSHLANGMYYLKIDNKVVKFIKE